MAELIRYDGTTRKLTAISDYMPQTWFVKKKNYEEMPRFKSECMKGVAHPLNIEHSQYELVDVYETHVDLSRQQVNTMHQSYSDCELGVIETVVHLPQVEWAIDNSFDGLYILKEDDLSEFRSIFKFGVYLHAEMATFWNVKYLGRL